MNSARQGPPPRTATACLAEFGDLGGGTDWGGKLAGAVVRIAGLLHMAEPAQASAPWEDLVAEATLSAAIRPSEYLIAHAHAAFAEMALDEVVEDALSMLRWIESRAQESFSLRDLHQAAKGRKRFRKVDSLWPGLNLLVSHGFIRQRHQHRPTGAPGRSPSPIFDVSPLWHPQYPHNPRNPANSVAPDTSDDCRGEAIATWTV